jgi:hypothetical protein
LTIDGGRRMALAIGEFSDMRRWVLVLAGLAILAGSLSFVGAATAQRACVLDPEGYVVCGPLVQPGYAPPPDYRGPPPYDDGRRYRDYDRRERDGDRRRAEPKCQKGYTVQGGVCKPYRAPPTCQKGYTVQDGVCKPYTGR